MAYLKPQSSIADFIAENKNGKVIELARKRGWKGYWVCLKGTTLLFYPCDSREGRSVEAAPKHLIIVDGAIMQPIPEHPKRDYIFCLSTAFGDAYLFQAPCQVIS
uniref:PH domain-containing protein n=1 Tax=Megaselia scalaris TaxID=36166 RepID=T1GTC2_MEGSC